MSFQEGRNIHLELKKLIHSKLKLIDKPPKRLSGRHIRYINYKKQLKSLPAIGQVVEEHSVRLVELYHQNPVLGNYLLDLFQLTDHCIKVLWDTHNSRSQLKIMIKSKKGNKYKFAFECHYYLIQYKCFLQYHLIKTQIGYDPVMLQFKTAVKLPENFQKSTGTKSSIPFKIALCHELGFLNTPEFKSLNNNRKREVLQILIGGSDRQIKGNLAVLNPRSNDNPSRYTAHQYLGQVRKFLKLSR